MDNVDTGIEAAGKRDGRPEYPRHVEDDEVALAASSAESGPGGPPGPISRQAQGSLYKTPEASSLDDPEKVVVTLELPVPRPERREAPQRSTERAPRL